MLSNAVLLCQYNPYGGMGWMSAWSHMAADPGFGYVPPTLAELQQAMFAGPSGLSFNGSVKVPVKKSYPYE